MGLSFRSADGPRVLLWLALLCLGFVPIIPAAAAAEEQQQQGFAIEFTQDHTFIVGARRYGPEEFSYQIPDPPNEPIRNRCTVIHLGTPPEMAATDFLFNGAPIYANFGNWAITQRSITYIGRESTALIVLGVIAICLIIVGVVLIRPMWNLVRRLVGVR